jgi:hypothetical protein
MCGAYWYISGISWIRTFADMRFFLNDMGKAVGDGGRPDFVELASVKETSRAD